MASGPVAEVSDELLGAVARRVAATYDLDLVVLFGSAVTGDRGAAEDLDIGVYSERSIDILALTNDFIRELRVQEVDIADLRRADALLLMVVARDGIPLYQRTPSRFSEFVSLAAGRYADTAKFRESERQTIRDWLTARGLSI